MSNSKQPHDKPVGKVSEASSASAPGQSDGAGPEAPRSSRIAGFRDLNPAQRARHLTELGFLSRADGELLAQGTHTLSVNAGNRMIENVVGVFGLPQGIGINFLVNGRDYLVPLVVEEPSIVAALSAAAKVARLSGGFHAEATDPILIGQVQLVDPEDPDEAEKVLLANEEEILNLANSLHPKMVARGGGAIGIEVHRHVAPSSGKHMVVLHLLVDTRDAMGANLVNTMCEGVASLVETLTSGKVFLRILSNLTDRALVRAEMTVPVKNLEGKGFSGEAVRDGIILANDFAVVDPYRAATHNKGIMNGIDPVAIATGNDWRAIEAAAHAFAARDGRYRSLTDWSANAAGDLVGRIEIPMKVGIVGGPVQSNPTVGINHRLLGIESAVELAQIMGVIGLAQNFSAIKALSTEGIQQGHMNLHARTVANAAGAPPELFDAVVDALIESGEIKVWKAEEILTDLRKRRSFGGTEASGASGEGQATAAERSSACGKIILLGEHAVVYGSRAIAAPLPLAVEASVVSAQGDDVQLIVPRWGIEQKVRSNEDATNGLAGMLSQILRELDLAGRGMCLEVFPHVPRAAGLGASSALAVAIIRAVSRHFKLGLDDEAVNALAFECEKASHGTPSGVDNTVATYGRLLSFRRTDDGPQIEPLTAGASMRLVVGMSGKESLTARTVADVRRAWEGARTRYERIFSQIDELVGEGLDCVQQGDANTLGELFNLCHGLLNGLQLSTPELEHMVRLARDNGALGAKLTGGGGGGAMIALCPNEKSDPDSVVSRRIIETFDRAGFEALGVEIG